MKVVVIGTGFGRYAVAPAFKSLGCEVEIISPRDEDALVEAFSAPCDLVAIHSPPFLHLDHVRLAIAHKRNVLCDKPFGRNAGEAREMLDLAVSAGVLHFLNFEFRFDPLREKMKELLDSGAIGDPLHMSCTMFTSRGREAPYGWLSDKDSGGGWIGAYASHQVDALRWLFGDVETVSCLSRTDVRFRTVKDSPGDTEREATAEDALTAWFRMKNGVTASLDTAYAAAVDLPPQIILLGSRGVLQLTEMSELVLHRPEEETLRFPTPAGSNAMRTAMERWLGQVCEAVRSGQQTGPDFTAGLACAEVLDSMRRG